jgi:hypothetical protein
VRRHPADATMNEWSFKALEAGEGSSGSYRASAKSGRRRRATHQRAGHARDPGIVVVGDRDDVRAKPLHVGERARAR